jgi:hypothetical protein
MLALMSGFALCYLSLGWDVNVLWLWESMIMFTLFGWGHYGYWALIGVLTFVLMLISIWTFVQHESNKLSFFAIFTSSTVFFSPITFDDRTWTPGLWIYGAVACCYWILPCIADRLAKRYA